MDSCDYSVQTFNEDRRSLFLRIFPIVLIASTGWVFLAALITTHWTKFPISRPVSWLYLFLFILMMSLTRIEMWTLIFSRPVRYEIDEDEFRAYVGNKLKVPARGAGLERWDVSASFSRTWLYFGMCFGRNWTWPYLFGPRFWLKQPNGPATWVTAPMLFRWAHRGGADDVNAALQEAIGWGPGWIAWGQPNG